MWMHRREGNRVVQSEIKAFSLLLHQMFVCVFNKAHTLKQFIDSVKDLIDVCNIECNALGMRLQAMDSSMICLVDMYVDSQSDSVSEYRCDKPVCMGLNMGLFSNVLALAHANGPVALRHDTDALTMCFEDPYTELSVPLIDLQVETPEIPDDALGGLSITLPSPKLSKVITTMHQLAEQMTLQTTNEEVNLIIDNNIGTGGVSWHMETNINEPIRLLLGTKHMAVIMKGSGLCKTTKLHIGEPVIVDYTIDGLGHLRFYLAPRFE